MTIDFSSIKPGEPPELWSPDDPILDNQINYRERVISPGYYEFSFSGDNITDNENGYYVELGGSSELSGLGPLDTKIPLYRQKLDDSLLTRIISLSKSGGYKSDNGFLFCYIDGQTANNISTIIQDSTSSSEFIDVANSDLFQIGQDVIIINGVFQDVLFDGNTIFKVVSKPSSTEIELDRPVYVVSESLSSLPVLMQLYSEACIYISDGNSLNPATEQIGSGICIARFLMAPRNYKKEGECLSIYFKVSAVYST